MLVAILLGIVLVFPVFMIIQSWNTDYANLAQQGPSLDDTELNNYFANAAVQHQLILTILAIVEIPVLIVLALTIRALMRK